MRNQSLVTKVLDVFFIRKESITGERRSRYRHLIFGIIIVHLFGLSCCIFYSVITASPPITSISIFDRFIATTQIVALAVSLMLLLLSFKGEALQAQTFELVAQTSRSTTHAFTCFTEHIIWLRKNITPERYWNYPLHLFTSVSTPAYGVAATVPDLMVGGTKQTENRDERGLDEFIEYCNEWIAHFQRQPARSAIKPTWEIAVWEPDANRSAFGHKLKQRGALAHLVKFAAVLEKIRKLHVEERVNVSLFYTDRSDARVFMVSSGGNSYGGLLVTFTPLTPSAIMHNGWILTGVSFTDREAFENIAKFNSSLQRRDHDPENPRRNFIEELSDPYRWLEKHYGLAQGALVELRASVASQQELDGLSPGI